MTKLDRILRNLRSSRVGDCGHRGQLVLYRGRRRCIACTLAAIPRRPLRALPEDELRDQVRRLWPDPS